MLRMGGIAIWILNALTSRPGEQSWDEKIVQTTAAYEALDDQDLRDAEFAEELVIENEAWPMLDQRGCYFLNAVVEDGGALRCARARELEVEDYIKIYYQNQLSDLHQAFRDGEVRVQKKTAAAARPKRQQVVIEDGRHSPERDLPLNLAAEGVRLRPALLMNGRDMEGRSIAERAGELGEEPITLDRTINEIWQNFLRDILRYVPLERGIDAFCTLSPEDVESATLATYQTKALPFRAVWVKIAPSQSWKELFDRTFPSQRDLSTKLKEDRKKIAAGKPAPPLQQYSKCNYRRRWISVVENTQFSGDEKIRTKLLNEFKKLTWMPAGKKDRMWSSGGKENGTWTRIPPGTGSAVTIFINPAAGVAVSEITLAD